MLVKNGSCTAGKSLARPGNNGVSSSQAKFSLYQRIRNEVLPTLPSPTTLIFKRRMVQLLRKSEQFETEQIGPDESTEPEKRTFLQSKNTAEGKAFEVNITPDS